MSMSEKLYAYALVGNMHIGNVVADSFAVENMVIGKKSRHRGNNYPKLRDII